MPETVEDSRIEVTGTMDGSPRVEDTRVRVSDIVISREYRGWEPRKIAEQFSSIDVSDVYTALDYYESHKKDIRREIRESKNSRKLGKSDYDGFHTI
jgi:uncharacterized protein (DUF433 family)